MKIAYKRGRCSFDSVTFFRFEAFIDGVIAIIITIMVLELKVPHGESLEALAPLVWLVPDRRIEKVLAGKET